MRVGTSRACDDLWHPCQDHPHACGDKLLTVPVLLTVLGSSPCVWGQVPQCCPIVLCLRIIPMRVGTRWLAVIQQAVNEDHPHACGDKRRLTDRLSRRAGSSPCVWGQENINLDMENVQRIIPMRVGTSYRFCTYKLLNKDHPHACGDKRTK